MRRRGDLIISETPHGFVCANAGIDLSNVEDGWAALLPVDADRSAKHVRDALRARERRRGRGHRLRHVRAAVAAGLTDVAIGVSGIAAVVDLRDTTDALGRVLQVTEVAVADEIASAAELVMGKATERPGRDRARRRSALAARGFGARADPADERGPVPLSVVPAFVEARRSIRAFLPEPVPRADLDAIVEAACLAPAPHHSRPWRFVVVDTDDGKRALAQGMGARGGATSSPTASPPSASTSSSTRRTGSSCGRPRSSSAASRGTDSTAIPTSGASARSGAWRCSRSAPRWRT